MKKRLLSLLMAAAMLITMLPAMPALADNSTTPANSGVHFTKELVEGLAGQPSRLKLEAYVTGSVSSTETKIPADIVLVLDQSGSMDETISTGSGSNRSKLSVMKSAVTEFVNGIEGLNVNMPADAKHRVAIVGFGSPSGNGNNTESLTANQTNVSPVTSTSYEQYTGTLDEDQDYFIASGYGYQRIRYYQSSYRYDAGWYTVGFGGRGTAVDVSNTVIFKRVQTTSTVESIVYGVQWDDLTDATYKNSMVVCDASAIASDGAIGQAINKLDGNGATRTDLGLEMAEGIFASQDLDYQNAYADGSRSKIVVLITDGEPTTSNTFSNSVANDAIASAYRMKNGQSINDEGETVSGGSKAHVFSLYLGTPSTQSRTFLQYVSSNYPSAQSMTNGGTQAATTYYTAHSNSSAISV